MKDSKKTKRQLIREVDALRQHVTQLEARMHDLRELEAVLRMERRFVSAVLETVDALIVVMDPGGRIVRFNQACERATGYRLDEVKGKCVWDLFVSPDDVDRIRTAFDRLRAGDSPNSLENYWITKDGQCRLISWSNTMLLSPDGTVMYIIGTGIDLTELKETEQEVVEQEARIRVILDTTADGIITTDEQGVIESFNQPASRMFGYTPDEVIGRNVAMLILSPHCKQHDSYMAHDLRTGEKRLIGTGREVIGQRKDGTTFPVELAVSKLCLDDQLIFTSVVRDITDRKRAEEELQRADRLALVGQLASGLAHEIGTPLNVIEGNAELLRMELHERGLSTVELDTIVEQTDRITRLIQQLLTFAQPKQQPLEPLPLYTPLSHALRLLETRFRREAISAILHMPPDLPPIDGSIDQIEQVFLNILVNAWHAMPEGGTITIEGFRTNDHQVRIVFRDTGCGMSPEDLALAFEPFHSTKGKRGTGLGLAICKQIIESCRGTIDLESTPGRGTVVTITLPQAEPPDFTTQTEQGA